MVCVPHACYLKWPAPHSEATGPLILEKPLIEIPWPWGTVLWKFNRQITNDFSLKSCFSSLSPYNLHFPAEESTRLLAKSKQQINMQSLCIRRSLTVKWNWSLVKEWGTEVHRNWSLVKEWGWGIFYLNLLVIRKPSYNLCGKVIIFSTCVLLGQKRKSTLLIQLNWNGIIKKS